MMKTLIITESQLKQLKKSYKGKHTDKELIKKLWDDLEIEYKVPDKVKVVKE